MNMKLDKFLLPSRKLGNARTIRVYYPEDKSKRYPVLYVHDGEFCFRKDTPAEYESMELDLALEKAGKRLIIVTIEAMPWQIRTREYSPFPWVGEARQHLPEGQELGDVYIDWLVDVVKPFIDKQYTTLSDRDHTFMLGCSLGALISLYASVKYGDVFKKIGLLSLASWGNQKAILDYCSTHQQSLRASYFMRVGTSEGAPRNMLSLADCYVPLNLEVRDHLLSLGIKNLDFKINQGRFHKTAEWAKDMPDFISWLFK
jgi:predicted alpha/beta superfamily hydrolase